MQHDVTGWAIIVEAYCGARKRESFSVDLVTGSIIRPSRTYSLERLSFLRSHPPRSACTQSRITSQTSSVLRRAHTAGWAINLQAGSAIWWTWWSSLALR